MGEVIVTIRIMPDSPDTDMNKLLSKVDENCRVEKHEIHPVAFGLKALVIYIIVPDSAGTDDLETKLRAIPHVQSVEVVDVRRAL
jgi:elongation factor 1-beta